MCDIIRVKRSASCGQVKYSSSVHIIRSPWSITNHSRLQVVISVFLEDWHKKYIRAKKRSMYSNYNMFFIYFYLEVSKDEPYFWIDDMFVTGILARKVPHEIKIYNWKNSFLSDHRSKTFAFFRLTTYLILSAPFRHF